MWCNQSGPKTLELNLTCHSVSEYGQYYPQF